MPDWRHRVVKEGEADIHDRTCVLCHQTFAAGQRIAYQPNGTLLKVASPFQPVIHKDCVDAVASAVDDDPRPGYEKARASLLVGIS